MNDLENCGEEGSTAYRALRTANSDIDNPEEYYYNPKADKFFKLVEVDISEV